MDIRLKSQLEFMVEVDKMKSVLRQNLLLDKTRQESDAEHSWHFALTAMLLFEYAYSPEVNMLRVMKMALIHDIVEIYAGDTFAYDEKGNLDKLKRETAAADKIFAMLPPDEKGGEYRSLWEEFDIMQTPDPIYAASIDRLQPFIGNYYTGGHTWVMAQVKKDMILKRISIVKTGLPKLWPVIEDMINKCVENGYIKP